MRIHHQKHHEAYVTNFYHALRDLEDAITMGDPTKILGLQGAIKFNGGGSSSSTLPSSYLWAFWFLIFAFMVVFFDLVLWVFNFFMWGLRQGSLFLIVDTN